MRAKAKRRGTRKARKPRRTRKQRGGTYHIPKIIWGYWNTVVIPPEIKMFFDRKERLKGWEHRILNDTNLPVGPPPSRFEELSMQHKADWIRLAVIEKYGGCWMDTTIILNDPKAIEDLYDESVRQKVEMTAFYSEKYSMGHGPEGYIENWFIMAPPNSELIKRWKREFEHAISMGFDKYKEHVSKIMDVNYIYNGTTYLTMHVCILMVLRDYKPKMLLKRAEDTMYKVTNDCHWVPHCTAKSITTNPTAAKKIPFIKISSVDVKDFDFVPYFT
jgi:hypothetical protein